MIVRADAQALPLADCTVDAIVTDPPYGLTANKAGGSGAASMSDTPAGRSRIGTGNGPGGFMGKKWDAGVPGPEAWAEALRVAKPGAHLVAFGGTRTFHRLTCAIEDAGWEIRDALCWLYGSGFPKSLNGPWGGTALKPGWEPIILARKPLDGTVAANVERWGTGGIDVDGCRIGVDGGCKGAGAGARVFGDGLNGTFAEPVPGLGRWPANVVLDEEAAAMLDEQSGPTGAFAPATGRTKDGFSGPVYGGGKVRLSDPPFYSDSGGASRFFYCAKASREEREAGCESLPMRSGAAAVERQEGTDGLKSPRAGAGRTAEGVRNHHPTVKPVSLMRWLCRLVTPKGGLVLDPFCGSGSTGVAAAQEGLRFVGIDLSSEYVQIARARVSDASRQKVLAL